MRSPSPRLVSVSSSPLRTAGGSAAPLLRRPTQDRKHPRRAPQHLRLVAPKSRRRRSPALMVVAATVIVALFGLAAFHNLMAGAQYDLERLERELDLEQARLVDLEFQIEQHNAPGSIELLARGALGMIDSPDAVDLVVQSDLLAEVQTVAGGQSTEADLAADWSTVKPLLGAS